MKAPAVAPTVLCTSGQASMSPKHYKKSYKNTSSIHQKKMCSFKSSCSIIIHVNPRTCKGEKTLHCLLDTKATPRALADNKKRRRGETSK